jgi:hypothetical protein
MAMGVDLSQLNLSTVITAVGGLGTAAFGLVEALKPIFGSINRMGLKHIQQTVASLAPTQASDPQNVLPQKNILATIEANWINGTELSSQKAIAKSLIKLHLTTDNAGAVAKTANVDPNLLQSIAHKTTAGIQLLQTESDVFARFEVIVTAMLDEAYQSSDQVYRNGTRTLAAFLAVVLAVAGAWSLEGQTLWGAQHWHDIALAVLVGILATPLAPVAKDISNALSTAVSTMQTVKKAGF